MNTWKVSSSELPPLGQEVLVALVTEDRSTTYAIACVEEVASTGEAYWASCDDMIHGLSCEPPAEKVILWMELPPVHSIDGNTSHG